VIEVVGTPTRNPVWTLTETSAGTPSGISEETVSDGKESTSDLSALDSDRFWISGDTTSRAGRYIREAIQSDARATERKT